MTSRRNSIIAASCIVLATVSLVAAQTASTEPETPYVAEVIGIDVYLRSGAGTVFYFCGKANAPTRVTVVSHMHGWSEVIPLQGNFSWISKEYVDRSTTNPQVGIVNGNGVRVWAGSDYVEPMRSTSLQVKLNKGDIVKLIDADSQTSDYYKIAPPPGAHLWVSSELLKYVGPLPTPALSISPAPSVVPNISPTVRPVVESTVPPVIRPAINPVIKPIVIAPVESTATDVKPTIESTVPPVIAPTVTPSVTPTVTPTATTPAPTVTPAEITATVPTASEAKLVKDCYDIAEKIRQELAKPLEVQDYTQFINPLTKIQEDPQAGKAQKYAQYQLDRIKRFQLARLAGEDLLKQDAELEKMRQEIRDKYKTQIAAIPNPGRHIVKGQIKPSLVFTTEAGQKRYKIINEQGRIVCYAMPDPQAATIDIESLLNRRVGLEGTMVNDKNNPVGLVIFTAIEDLQNVPEKTSSDNQPAKTDAKTAPAPAPAKQPEETTETTADAPAKTDK